jgi:hypothetical protein
MPPKAGPGQTRNLTVASVRNGQSLVFTVEFFQTTGANWVLIQIVFVCVYCASASVPLSRAKEPDCLYPPKGVLISPSENPLTDTVPQGSERAMWIARSMSRVKTVACSLRLHLRRGCLTLKNVSVLPIGGAFALLCPCKLLSFGTFPIRGVRGQPLHPPVKGRKIVTCAVEQNRFGPVRDCAVPGPRIWHLC